MKLDRSIPVPSQRINVIDALRGFALLGVILMHMLQYYGYTSPFTLEEIKFPGLDMMIRWFSSRVISGRFINIFSFLFGLSFFIQMDRASKKGIDFRGRFLWRMALLFVIGLVGSAFTYVDILTFYAIFGVILVFLYPLKKWILFLIVCFLLSGIPYMTIIGFNNIRMEHTTTVNPSLMPEPSDKESMASTAPVENARVPDSSFFETVKDNLTTKTIDKLQFQFVFTPRGHATLALFILGFIVGRLRFFEEVNIRRKRNLNLFVGFLLASIITEVTIHLIQPKSPINLIEHIAKGIEIPFIEIITINLKVFGSLLQSGTYALGFIILYQTRGVGKYLDLLSSYGRMGLTNYEIQGVVGAILFSTWGFGAIFGRWGATELFLFGLIIYTTQIIISKCWMKHFLYGPLEWLWRSGTYLRWQPIKRK